MARRAGARVTVRNRRVRVIEEHEREQRHGHSDGHGHPEPAYYGQRRVLAQHAQSELEVQSQRAHPRDAPGFPCRLAVPIHATKRDERLPARFLRRQTARTAQLLRLHLHVKAHFRSIILFQAAAATHRQNAASPAGEDSSDHVGQPSAPCKT
jgi:hypothetical protein